MNPLKPESRQRARRACSVCSTVAMTLENNLEEARAQWEELAELGIDLDDVTHQLLIEGVEQFTKPCDSLIETMSQKKMDLIAT